MKGAKSLRSGFVLILLLLVCASVVRSDSTIKDQNQNLSKDKIEDQTGLSNSKIQKDNKDIKEEVISEKRDQNLNYKPKINHLIEGKRSLDVALQLQNVKECTSVSYTIPDFHTLNLILEILYLIQLTFPILSPYTYSASTYTNGSTIDGWISFTSSSLTFSMSPPLGTVSSTASYSDFNVNVNLVEGPSGSQLTVNQTLTIRVMKNIRPTISNHDDINLIYPIPFTEDLSKYLTDSDSFSNLTTIVLINGSTNYPSFLTHDPKTHVLTISGYTGRHIGTYTLQIQVYDECKSNVVSGNSFTLDLGVNYPPSIIEHVKSQTFYKGLKTQTIILPNEIFRDTEDKFVVSPRILTNFDDNVRDLSVQLSTDWKNLTIYFPDEYTGVSYVQLVAKDDYNQSSVVNFTVTVNKCYSDICELCTGSLPEQCTQCITTYKFDKDLSKCVRTNFIRSDRTLTVIISVFLLLITLLNIVPHLLMKSNISSLFAIYCYIQLLLIIPFLDLYTPKELREAFDAFQVARGDYMFIDSIIPVQKSLTKSFKGSMYMNMMPIGFNSISIFVNFFHFMMLLIFLLFTKLTFRIIVRLSVVQSREKLNKLVSKINDFLNPGIYMKLILLSGMFFIANSINEIASFNHGDEYEVLSLLLSIFILVCYLMIAMVPIVYASIIRYREYREERKSRHILDANGKIIELNVEEDLNIEEDKKEEPKEENGEKEEIMRKANILSMKAKIKEIYDNDSGKTKSKGSKNSSEEEIQKKDIVGDEKAVEVDEDFEGGENEFVKVAVEAKPSMIKQIFLLPLLDDLCDNYFGRIYHSLMIFRKILLVIFMVSIGEAYIQIFLILILQMACLMYTILSKPFKYQKTYLCAVGGEISLTATSVLITKLFDKPYGYGGGILNDYNEIALIIICVNGAVIGAMLIINIIIDYMLCFQFFQPSKVGIQFTLGEQKRKGHFVYNSDNVQLSFEDDLKKQKNQDADLKLVDLSKACILQDDEENKNIEIAQFDDIGVEKKLNWTKKKTMGVKHDELNRSGVQNTKDPSSKEERQSNEAQNIDLEDSSASMMHFKKTLSSIWIDRDSGSEKNKQSAPIMIKVNENYKSEEKASIKSSKIEAIIVLDTVQPL